MKRFILFTFLVLTFAIPSLAQQFAGVRLTGVGTGEVSNPSGIPEGALANDYPASGIRFSNATWSIADQLWVTECSRAESTHVLGSLNGQGGCDEYDTDPETTNGGNLRFGGFTGDTSYGLGDRVTLTATDVVFPCGQDLESQTEAAAEAIDGDMGSDQYVGLMKFLRIETDTELDANGGHLEVMLAEGREDGVPGATYAMYKEFATPTYNFTAAARPACGTPHDYALRVTLDTTSVDSGGEGLMEFFIDGSLVFNRTSSPTLGGADHTTEAGQLITYYNGYVQPGSDPLQILFGSVSLTGEEDVFTPPAAVAYSTLVVFGDNQRQSIGCDADPWVDPGPSTNDNCQDWHDSIQWVIDNKTTENIAGVMFVGDLIDAGTKTPHMIDENCALTPVVAEGTCRAEDGVQASCEAVDGCFYFGTGTSFCHSCTEWFTKMEDEWDAFETGRARLTAEGIPVMLTRGNHDNPGALAADERQPEGWNQRYDQTFWEGIENGTTFDFLSTDIFTDASGGNGYAWKLTMDSQEFIIAATPSDDGDSMDAAGLAWAISTFGAYADLPAILLCHFVGGCSSAITNQSETVAPNLFWVAGGHTRFLPGSDVVYLDTAQATEVVLETTSDWTTTDDNDTNLTLQDDYITLFRWYGAGDPSIEVDNFSVQGPNTSINASNMKLAKTAFDVMPPAVLTDLDTLLAPYSTEMTTVFGGTPPTQPTEPTINPANNVTISTDDCPALDAALSTAETHVTITTGTTLNCSSAQAALTASDIRLTLEGTATLNVSGSMGAGGNSRIIVEGDGSGGGTITASSGDISFSSGADLIVRHLNLNTPTGSFSFTGRDRTAVYSNTITSENYAIQALGQIADASSDIYIVNNDLYGNGGNGPTVRTQYKTRMVQAHNRLSMTGLYDSLWRFWGSQQDVLAIDNYSQANASGAIPMWSASMCAAGTDQSGEQDNVFLLDNKLYNSVSGTLGLTQGYENPPCQNTSSCTDMTVNDNILYTPSAPGTFTINNQDNACTNLSTSNNTVATYTTFPSASSLGIGAGN